MEPAVSEKPGTRDGLAAQGEALIGAAPVTGPVVGPSTAPNGFPPSIPVDTITFTDWSQYVVVESVQIARVSSAADVAAVCNWAAQNSFTVRAMGEGHNWSPILLVPGTPPNSKVMLVDTTKLVSCSFQLLDRVPLATFGTGITIDAASAYLQTLENGGTSAAPGFAFPHATAPGNLTLGGILAIGGHGTLVPSGTGSGTGEEALMGCLSNLIMGFDAVVTEPDGPNSTSYAVRHFERTETDAAAFLVHLGRAFLTSVTLRVVPNYYLQLHCLFPKATDLFAPPSTAPSNPSAFANLLDTYGRVEVLWFPYNLHTFAQCNMLQTTAIEPQVAGPYNYPWMNDITPLKNKLIKAGLFAFPKTTPVFTAGELALTQAHLDGKVLNGTARDLEIYLKDTTLRVALFGWALQVPRGDVQQVVNLFFEKVKAMLDAAETAGTYPINAAMEIRCTTIDRPGVLPTPALAATHSVAPHDPTLDTVVWLNVGTVTGTPGSNAFYTELETWLLTTWGQTEPNRLRPEWSKGWAYTASGPWTNPTVLQAVKAAYNQPGGDALTLKWAASTLASYDQANIFTNALLGNIFST